MKYDAIIIGAGILGISHAYHIAASGRSVLLLEKSATPRDASVRNFGQVVPSGFGSKWQQYGRESLKHYKKLEAYGDTTIRQEGSLYIASDDEEMTLLEELSDINRSNGYSSELQSKNQCLSRIPALNTAYVVGGLFFPEEVIIDPYRGIAALLDICIKEYNIMYQPLTAVCRIDDTPDGVEVHTAIGKKYTAENVYVCSGKEVSILYPELFQASDMEIVKLQMMEVACKQAISIPGSLLTGWTIRRYEAFRECPSYATISANESPDAFHKKWGIHILFKQLLDGNIILGDSHEYYDVAAGNTDFFTSMEINDFILAEAKKIMNMEDATIQRTWNGVYTQCKENDLLHEKIGDHIHIVTGVGGKGMTASLGYTKEHVASIYS